MAQLSAKDVALICVFAALFPVVDFLHLGFPIIGGQGRINFDALLGPISALILGPWLGFLATAIGALTGWFIVGGGTFGLFTTTAPMVSAFVAGAICMKRIGSSAYRVSLPGWLGGLCPLVILTGLWYVTWVGRAAPFYPVLQFAAILVILTLRGKMFEFFQGSGKRRVALAAALASYCGLVADHMLGNLIFINVIGWVLPVEVIENWLALFHLPDVPSLFMFVLPISIAERLIMTAIATGIGVSLVLALRRLGLVQEAKRVSYEHS